jgi:hypothetical protein
MSSEIIWNDCRKCNQNTKHSVLGKKSKVTHPDIYHDEKIYFLLECNGCETIAFREEYHDYEQYYPISEDEYEHPISVETYPHFIKDHVPLEYSFDLPLIVENIYRESITAIQREAYTLAGLGLRATIEAICNDKEITGKNLQVRINNMSRSGMISKSDTQRLHAIRFMGNDAAHEIKKAKKESVMIALKIVEHLLLSVYVFESEVSKYLETPISTLDELIPILDKKLKIIDSDSTFTFVKLLGSSKRRILEGIESIESEFIQRVKDGNYDKVELTLKPDGSAESSQWFKKATGS